MNNTPEPAAGSTHTPDNAALLEAWAHWLKRGLIKDWPQERAEVAYHAFCAAWVTASAHAAAAERERIRRGLHAEFVPGESLTHAGLDALLNVVFLDAS